MVGIALKTAVQEAELERKQQFKQLNQANGHVSEGCWVERCAGLPA